MKNSESYRQKFRKNFQVVDAAFATFSALKANVEMTIGSKF